MSEMIFYVLGLTCSVIVIWRITSAIAKWIVLLSQLLRFIENQSTTWYFIPSKAKIYIKTMRLIQTK